MNPLNMKQYTHDNKRYDQHSEVEVQDTLLIAGPPEQHPYHVQGDTIYFQLSSPVFEMSSPDVNTIFDAQGFSNYLPANSHLQNQLNLPLQSPQLSSLSSNHKSLVLPSLSSMSSSTNIHSYPQSVYKHLDSMSTHLPTAQYIPSHLLPSYDDIQYIHYKSPLTAIQQPIMSHQQDYLAIYQYHQCPNNYW